MEMRTFGRTGMPISVLGFGCGAVGGLMVRGDPADQERAVARALEAGVNYFDTAVQYGDGASEQNLGRVLKRLKPANALVGTKVRLSEPDRRSIADAARKSLEGSLARFLGFTAIGETAALHEIVDAGVFDAAQLTYNLLNPSAAQALPSGYPAQDYARLFART
jgi:L-galactose dehydrogenase/L-glyceraldehyde 3-phosphate reductase